MQNTTKHSSWSGTHHSQTSVYRTEHCWKVTLKGEFTSSPASSVSRDSGYESQGCGFKSILVYTSTQVCYSTLITWFLSSCIKFCSVVADEKSEMPPPTRGQGGHLCFPIGQKNTNLVEYVEYFLPAKFHQIPLSCCKTEVKMSTNHRPRRPSLFSDRPGNKSQTWYV